MDGSVYSLLVLSRLNNMLKTHLLDKISNMGSYLKYCLHVANEHITLLTEKGARIDLLCKLLQLQSKPIKVKKDFF